MNAGLFKPFLIVVVSLPVARAVNPAFPAQAGSPNDETREERMAEALEMAKAIKVQRVAGRQERVELIEKPLLTYGDVPRDNDTGTMWAWGRSGRPLAVLELFKNTHDGRRGWVHGLTLTSTELVKADVGAGSGWSPRKAGAEFQPLTNAASPALEATQRLRQMKELARRFVAHEFWDPDNQRYELRLLAQPIHQYSDPKSKILDGAAFLFAHGTNPEVILLIEAVSHDKSTTTWQYGLVRTSSAELHVSLDGREAWVQPRAPGVSGQPIDPYWMFYK